MFTGIIRHIGHVTKHEVKSDESTLTITAPFSTTLNEGDSVAVNGACLTVLEQTRDTFTTRLMAETLAKTNLGQLKTGNPVNLELPLTASQSFDGHFVTGHIDATARVTDSTPRGNDKIFTIEPPQDLMRYLVPKGTVALDGVSLTIVDVISPPAEPRSERQSLSTTGDKSLRRTGSGGGLGGYFTVSMMPYTLEHTIFGSVTPGYRTNIETDLLAKHVVKLLENQQPFKAHA